MVMHQYFDYEVVKKFVDKAFESFTSYSTAESIPFILEGSVWF